LQALLAALGLALAPRFGVTPVWLAPGAPIAACSAQTLNLKEHCEPWE
jgi:hypothetical protein